MRKRVELGCGHVKIFGDVKKKHCSHALTADLDITDVVKQAEFFSWMAWSSQGREPGNLPNSRN